MADIQINLLGSPRLTRADAPLTLGRRKAVALIAYLAVTRQSHSRDALAALFWPDASQSNARTALRRVIADLKKALGDDSLELIGDTVMLSARPSIRTDVEIFRTILVKCQIYGPLTAHTTVDIAQLTAATALYEGDFLAGFTLPDCRIFDEWQFFQAEALRRDCARALELLVHELRQQQEWEQALHFAHRWADLDPLHEAPHKALLHIYAAADRRSAALRHYERYAGLMQKEFGSAPDTTLTDLYESIRHGNLRDPTSHRTHFTTRSTPSDEPSPQSAPLAAKADDEIRLVTVLVIGLGRRHGRKGEYHPEEVADALSKLTPLISEIVVGYGGVVDRFLGDALQVIFGTPTIHEDDPTRAIQAAVNIRQQTTQLGLPIAAGISTGRVYFSNLALPQGTETLAIGPVISLALRLHLAAMADRILVCGQTYRYSRAMIESRVVSLTLTEESETIMAHEVVRLLPRPEQERLRKAPATKLVGREEELATLQCLFRQLCQGNGRVVSIIGEAGLGSSRLISELKRWAFAHGTDPIVADPSFAFADHCTPIWLATHALPLRYATSYSPFIEVLQEYLTQICPADCSPSQAFQKTITELVRADILSAARAEELFSLLTVLLALPDHTARDEPFQPIDSEQARHQTFLAIYDFLVALSQKQPLILAFEDLQWADDLSLDLLTFLLDAIPTYPLLLICAYRPYWQRKRWRYSAIAYQKCPTAYTELWLRELTPEQSRHLITSLLGEVEPPAMVIKMVQEKARGNPFFISEALNALTEAGTIRQTNGQWQVTTEMTTFYLPESVYSVVLSRIDLLPALLRLLLRTAAVIGRIFPLRILERLLPSDFDLDNSLSTLEDVALIYRERTVPEVVYSFSHVLTQESIYRTNARRQRRKLHEQVAIAIEALYYDSLSEHYEQLAHHYAESDAKHKAIDYLLKSGETSRRNYLNSEAHRYYRQALNYLTDEYTEHAINGTPQHVRPLQNNDARSVDDAHGNRQSSSPATPTKQSIDATTTVASQMLAALTGLGQIYHAMGLDHADEAEAYLREAIRIGPKAGIATAQLVRLYYWLGELLFWQGRYDEQMRLGELGLHLLDRSQAESVEAVLMHHLVAVAERRQGYEERYAATVTTTARFIGQLPYSEELRPAYMHIINLQMIRDSNEAKRWLEQAEALAHRHHDLRALAELQDYKWLYAFQRGDLAAATAAIPRSITLYGQIGDQSRVWRALTNQCWTLLLQGDVTGAQIVAEQAVEMAHSLRLERLLAESYLDLGVVWTAQEAWNKAATAFARVHHFADDLPDFWGIWAAFACLGQLALRQLESADAAAHFAQAANNYTALSALGWRQKWSPVFLMLLRGLEEAGATSAQLIHYCETFQQARGQARLLPLPTQCRLLPANQLTSSSSTLTFQDRLVGQPADGWRWIDPQQDCSMQPGEALLLQAANGRDLWYMNRSAPRLLRPLVTTEAISTQQFMVQVCCQSASDASTEKAAFPAIGGLLLWHDDAHFLTLTWGNQGCRDIAFGGAIGNETVFVGRGLLPESDGGERADAQPSTVQLKLQITTEQTEAFCSPDGVRWFSAGQIQFHVTAGAQIGLYAAAWIDRVSYPGAHRDGSAICFADFRLWKSER